MDRLDRGHERVRLEDDLVAARHPGGEQREQERVRPGGDAGAPRARRDRPPSRPRRESKGAWLPGKCVDFWRPIAEGAWVGAWAERAFAAPRHTMAISRATTRVAGWPITLALALGAGALLAIRLDAPAFFDNEGRYAE